MSDSEIYLEIATEFKEAGLPEKALVETDNAIKAYEKNFGAHYLKAETLAELGKMDEAMAALDVVSKILPEEFSYLQDHWTGVIYFRKGNFKKAVELAESSVAKEPKFVENYVFLSKVYPMTGDFDKGIKHAEIWTELEPEEGDAWENLGITAIMAGRYNLADKALTKALKISPESSQAYNYLGRMADQQKKYKLAEKHYKKSIALKEQNPYVYLSLGQMFMNMGKMDEAFVYLKKSNEQDPTIAYTHFWIGKYRFNRKEYSRSFEQFNRAVELDVALSIARTGVAESSLMLGDKYDEAMEVLKEGMATAPGYRRNFYFYLGRLSLAKKDFGSALGFAEKSIAMFDKSAKKELAALHLLKGDIYRGKGDSKSANVEYDITLKLAPSSDSGKKAKKRLES